MTRAALILALLMPSAALAHAGGHDGNPFLAGLLHPIGGADHVAAMLAVGLWAAICGGRALWLLPLAFVAGMPLGAAVTLPMVEPAILLSILALGLAAALALRPPVWSAAAAVAAFGLFHGAAHGAEGPAAGAALYALGFTTTTLALHLAGLAAGLALQRAAARAILRGLGGVTAVAGLALAFA